MGHPSSSSHRCSERTPPKQHGTTRPNVRSSGRNSRTSSWKRSSQRQANPAVSTNSRTGSFAWENEARREGHRDRPRTPVDDRSEEEEDVEEEILRRQIIAMEDEQLFGTLRLMVSLGKNVKGICEKTDVLSAIRWGIVRTTLLYILGKMEDRGRTEVLNRVEEYQRRAAILLSSGRTTARRTQTIP